MPPMVFPPTRRGYDVKEVVSAVQKAIRRSDPDAALYWATELWRSGYADWLFRRLDLIVVEDVSPTAGVMAEYVAIKDMHRKWRGKPALRANPDAGNLWMLKAVVLLAMAPKNRVVQWAAFAHFSDEMPRREIPDEALDMHTAKGRKLKRGADHFKEEGAQLQDPRPGVLEELEAEYATYWPKKDTDVENPWDAPRLEPDGSPANLSEAAEAEAVK